MKPHAMIFAPSAYPLGGVATWLEYLVPGLVDRGWKVTLALVDGPKHHRAEEYLALHPRERAVVVSCRTGTPAGRRRAVRRAIRRVRPDLAVTVNLPDAAAAAHAALDRNSPRIAMTCHGIEPELFADMRRLRPALDAVVCTNRLACKLAATAGETPPPRVYYAPYGVRPAAALKPTPCDRLRIAFVGRLEESQKRVGDLPRVVRELSTQGVPFLLDIAGDGPGRDSLQQDLAEFVFSGQTRFLGRLSEAELVAKVYRSADALLITSSWETGPIVAWEAMAHGVPVVTSQYVGSGLEAALLHEENSLLFPVGDAASAARQLARLWDDGLLSRRLTAGGRRLVDERYSVATSIRAWDEVLRDVLAAPPLPPGSPPRPPMIHSRLDRWFGVPFAETIRACLRPPCGDSPASEWPHAWSDPGPLATEFWQAATRLDANEVPPDESERTRDDQNEPRLRAAVST